MGGSSSTRSTQIPDYLSDASRLATQRANQIYEAGRMPFTGIDVVGLNPSEKAAMENVASAASAFGMAVPQGDPFAGMEAQTTNGLTGYSSMPIYISDMQRLKEQRPDQYAAFARLTGFDPITGEAIAPVYTGGAYYGGGGGGSYGLGGADPNEHYDGGGISPLADSLAGPSFTSKLDTKGQIGKYSNPSHGLSFGQKLKADLGYAAATAKKDIGKLFGGFGGK